MAVSDLYVVEGVDRHGVAVRDRTRDADAAAAWAEGINRRGGSVTVRRLTCDGTNAAFVDPADPSRPPEGDA